MFLQYRNARLEAAKSCRTQRQYLESIGISGDASFAAPINTAYSSVVMRWTTVKTTYVCAMMAECISQ
jgi:hypothetical protein